MQQIGDKVYKMLFLDSNALREITRNTGNSGKAFLTKFMSDNCNYAPCFSFYNVVEIMPYHDIFEEFLDLFSTIPCMMFYPIKSIIEEENLCYTQKTQFKISNKVANAFTPIIYDESYNLRKFLKASLSGELLKTIEEFIQSCPSIAIDWEKNRHLLKQEFLSQGLAESLINQKFFLFQERDTLLKDLSAYSISFDFHDDPRKYFPSLRIIEQSLFSRVHLTKKPIKPNDVMDVQISGYAPYVDAIITENFQADVLKKAKNSVPQIKELEIYTLQNVKE